MSAILAKLPQKQVFLIDVNLLETGNNAEDLEKKLKKAEAHVEAARLLAFYQQRAITSGSPKDRHHAYVKGGRGPAKISSWMVFDIPTGINKGPVVSKWNNDAKRANPSPLVIRLPWTSHGLTAKRRTEAQSGQHITTDILAFL
ncbi:hypothetical protein ACFE04_031295 [Oxalis oulophora]